MCSEASICCTIRHHIVVQQQRNMAELLSQGSFIYQSCPTILPDPFSR
jgi:hypothetical protein